jgi:hypothetical protein
VHPKSTAGWTDQFKNPITGIHTFPSTTIPLLTSPRRDNTNPHSRPFSHCQPRRPETPALLSSRGKSSAGPRSEQHAPFFFHCMAGNKAFSSCKESWNWVNVVFLRIGGRVYQSWAWSAINGVFLKRLLNPWSIFAPLPPSSLPRPAGSTSASMATRLKQGFRSPEIRAPPSSLPLNVRFGTNSAMTRHRHTEPSRAAPE